MDLDARLAATEREIAALKLEILRHKMAGSSSAIQTLQAVQKIAAGQTDQLAELTLAISVALNDLARTAGADVNGLILVLEKHLELREDRDPKPATEFAQALVAGLRIGAR